jgi:hypothetical protein
MPPGQLPRWHGPANLRQPVNSVPMGQARAAPTLPALSLTNSRQMTHLHTLPPPSTPPQQVDVFFALAKGNWHCGNPLCRKPLDPWAANGADNAMCIARVQNYIYHDGLRGPTAADNNLRTYRPKRRVLTTSQASPPRMPGLLPPPQELWL